MTEVWSSAPVSGGELLVLLSLADAAGDDHRMAWISVPTIAKKARMKERQTYNCLKSLTEAGLLEDVNDEDAPKEAKHYSSAVRRITPSTQWRSLEVPPANIAPLHSTAPNPSSTTGVGSKEQEELRSSVLTLAPSGRKGRKGKAQPELEDDPQSHVLAELESEGERPARRVKATIADPTAPRHRTKRLAGSGNLSRLFGILGKEVGHPVPGITNEAAVRGTVQRWMNEGATYETCRAMIEAYWSAVFVRSESKPAWQDFIASRGPLFDLVARETKIAQVEEDRYDPSKW